MVLKENQKAVIYLTMTILLWSLSPAIAKIALAEIDNFQLLFYTSLTGIFSLVVVNLLQSKLKHIVQYKRSDYLKMFGMGAIGIFLYHVFLFGSFSLAPAGQANVINYLWPVFIIVFSIPLLKEKYNTQTIVAVVISLIGAAFALTKGTFTIANNSHFAGYLLAAAGALCYGLFSVLGKKLVYDKSSSMLVYYIAGFLLILPTSYLISGFKLPVKIETIAAILFLGGIINSLAFVLWFKALQLGHTHKTANLVYTVPFLAMLWTYFLNNESFEMASVAGLLLIVLGIIIQLINKI